MPGAPTPIFSRAVLPVWLLLPLPLLALACENTPTPIQLGKVKPTGLASTGPGPTTADKPYTPPPVTAGISQVKLNWKDRQQFFTITLTNSGDKEEIVHAVVYGTNNTANPPRRGISPPTATDWFGLVNSRDGVITAADIEKNWKTAGFLSARGGRLRRTWDEKVGPNATIEVLAAHDLDDKSPHPQWKGKPLAAVPYTEYHLWLFSPEGFCFFEETVPAFGPPPVKPTPTKTPDTKPAPPKVMETKPAPKPVNPKDEALASTELRLATTYLELNRKQDARDKLNLILKKFPDTAAATKARELLDRVQ